MSPGRFPSIVSLLKAAGDTFLRFPLTLVSGFVAAIFAVRFLELSEKSYADSYILKLFVIAALGLSLFTVLALTAEKLRRSRAERLLIQGIGLLLLVGYFFSLPDNFMDVRMHPVRFLLIGIALHFLVAYLPFLGKDQLQGFWQYNKSLFLRLLIAVLYSGVLYIGLVIALAAMDFLFGVDVDDKRYIELWMVMAFVGNTWIFLAGIPDDLNELNTLSEYPKGLKIFAQYILLPLIGLYLVILYIYEFKIIFQWNWPKGWVSELVLWYSAVGILALLLLWPLRDREENRWIRTYVNWFFRLLVPLAMMLFFAILYRVGDYGMTPPRYFVLAMAVGLSVVVLYFIFSRTKDIRVIPIILSLIAILSAYGPWSAFSISERSQLNRLQGYLDANELPLSDGLRPTASIPFEDRREMSSIVVNLCEWYSADAFSRWLDDSSLARLDTLKSYELRDSIAARLGFSLVFGSSAIDAPNFLSIYADRNDPVGIAGYDQLVRYRFGRDPLADSTSRFALNESDTLSISLAERGNGLLFTMTSPQQPNSDTIMLPLGDTLLVLQQMMEGRTITQGQVTFDIDTRQFRARLILLSANGTVADDSVTITYIDADVLVGKR